ncbi:uncharacterized protein [Lolium perenne]|uniref:uncharacterized protein isoform X2 n=1 Tax=Lolium perenne TaxID=4522 RepID=UPI003A9A0C20
MSFLPLVMLKVRSGKNISQMTGAIHCYSLFLFIYLGSHLLLLIIFYFILVLFYEASTPLLLCGGEQADLSDADGLMEASNEEPGLLAFKSTSVTRWSKHLPWLIELHSGNQGRTEPKVSTIAEIATFESNYIMGFQAARHCYFVEGSRLIYLMLMD